MNTKGNRVRFRIPPYDCAFNKFFALVVDGFIDTDPLLSQIHRSPVKHMGPIRNVRGEEPLDQDLPPIKGESLIKTTTIRETNFDEITIFFYEVAQEFRAELERGLLKCLNEVTHVTGQVINFKGKPFSPDMLNEILEKMPIDFNENGKPMLPTMIIPPEMETKLRGIKETPEQRKRFEEIIAKKRIEFYAKKRTRRLS
ncbi:MAG: hypothetical protein JXA42_01260 [Anaerolineales bacterium]|nr:hypothetical protein [Anaerolineales bacterium]